MRWDGKLIGDIVDFFDSRRIPLNSRQRAERQGPYPYYGASGIFDYIDAYIFEGRYLLIAEDGENLNSRKLPIAFFANGRFWVNNHAHIIRGRSGMADDEFLKHWFAQANISGYVTGAAQPKLSQGSLKRVEIDLPPLHTQRRIASVLSAYDDLIENNTRRIAILEEMARRLYEEWFVRFRFPGHEEVEFDGDLPKGWVEASVEDFGQVITGKTPTKKRPDFFGGEVPFLRLPDMHGNLFAIQTFDTLTRDGANSQKGKFIPANSLCVSCIGTVGIVIITSKECQTNQQINSLVLDDIQAREFMLFTLKSLKGTIERYAATGATMANLSRGKFAALKFASPSYGLIVRFHEVSSPLLDQILILQRKNANLRAQRDLLLPKLVSGEIDVSNVEEGLEAVA